MTWQQIAERIDGAVIMVDGIECRVTVGTDRRTGEYTAEMGADPTPKGKRTRAYQETRRALGDDWSISWAETPEDVWTQLSRLFPEWTDPKSEK